MSGPWEDFKKPASDSATEDGEGPWSDFKAQPKKEEPGLGSKILSGVVKAAETIDSYTGAPTRAAISSLQDDVTEPGRAAGAFLKQFGENPNQAPTGRDIARKAGVSDTALSERVPGIYSESGEGIKLKRGGFFDPTASGMAGLGIDVTADPTAFLPVGAAAKAVGSAASKGVSGAIKVTAKALESGEKFIGKAGKKFVQGGFGISEDTITNYLAKHPTLKDKVGAREMAEELAGKVDQGLKPARDRLASAESAVLNAKAKRSEDLTELMVKRQEAKDSLRLAEEQSLGEAAARVSTRVNQLDKEVSAGSAKAFDILDKEGVRVPTKKLLSDMDKGAKALAERAVTDEQTLVAENLKKYADRIRSSYPEDIPGGEAKRILQSLDREMRHLAPGEIGRLSKEDQVLGIMRKRIDEPLKSSSAYAEQMKGVASDTRTLMDVKNLSSESAAARSLRAASRATGKDQAEIIQALEARYGDRFLDSVNRSNLPEYAKLKGVIQRYRAAKKGLSVKDAERSLEGARSNLGEASRMADNGIAGITDNISSYVRASSPSAKQAEALKKAGDLSGVNMIDELKDIKTISAFEKGYNRGSANTNFWGALAGGLVGSVAGPSGALVGAASGGTFGRMVVDNFGPAIGRKILDQVPMLQRMSPSKWVQTLDVPVSVKRKLEGDLLYHQFQTGTRSTSAASRLRTGESARKVAEEEEPKKGEDRWAQRGIENLRIKDAETANRILQSKEGKRLLIEASDLPPGSKKLQSILEKLSKGWGEKYGNEPGTVSETEILRQQRRPSSGR